MMPIVYASPNEENVIKKVGGNPEVKRHLEDLGLTPGAKAVLISKMPGNVIVKVKESRVAISEEMARKVMV